MPLCKFNLKGTCRYGSSCWYEHTDGERVFQDFDDFSNYDAPQRTFKFSRLNNAGSVLFQHAIQDLRANAYNLPVEPNYNQPYDINDYTEQAFNRSNTFDDYNSSYVTYNYNESYSSYNYIETYSAHICNESYSDYDYNESYLAQDYNTSYPTHDQNKRYHAKTQRQRRYDVQDFSQSYRFQDKSRRYLDDYNRCSIAPADRSDGFSNKHKNTHPSKSYDVPDEPVKSEQSSRKNEISSEINVTSKMQKFQDEMVAGEIGKQWPFSTVGSNTWNLPQFIDVSPEELRCAWNKMKERGQANILIQHMQNATEHIKNSKSYIQSNPTDFWNKLTHLKNGKNAFPESDDICKIIEMATGLPYKYDFEAQNKMSVITSGSLPLSVTKITNMESQQNFAANNQTPSMSGASVVDNTERKTFFGPCALNNPEQISMENAGFKKSSVSGTNSQNDNKPKLSIFNLKNTGVGHQAPSVGMPNEISIFNDNPTNLSSASNSFFASDQHKVLFGKSSNKVNLQMQENEASLLKPALKMNTEKAKSNQSEIKWIPGEPDVLTSLYSKMSDLSENDLKEFTSKGKFKLGKIPICPPPKELC